MNSMPGREGFRPPMQDRSRQTLDRIAQAALELMEENGVEGATVANIVDRAQASVGSFYARFPGKDDLIRFLRARVWTEARERWDEALRAESWEGVALDRVVEGVVSLLLRSFRADYRRRKSLGGDPGGDPEAAAHRLAFHGHLLKTLTPLFLANRDRITHPEPERAISFGYRFVVGAIREFLEVEEGQDVLPELGPELARAWMGYLAPAGEEEALGQDGAVDFFDPWG